MDAYSGLTVTQLLANGTQSGAFASTPVKVRDYVGQCSFVVVAGPLVNGDVGKQLTLRVETAGTDVIDASDPFEGVENAGTITPFASVSAGTLHVLPFDTRAYEAYARVQGLVTKGGRCAVGAYIVGVSQDE